MTSRLAGRGRPPHQVNRREEPVKRFRIRLSLFDDLLESEEVDQEDDAILLFRMCFSRDVSHQRRSTA